MVAGDVVRSYNGVTQLAMGPELALGVVAKSGSWVIDSVVSSGWRGQLSVSKYRPTSQAV